MPDLVVARRPRGRLIAASFEPRVPSTPTAAILEKPAPSAHHPSRSLPPLWIDRPDNRTPYPSFSLPIDPNVEIDHLGSFLWMTHTPGLFQGNYGEIDSRKIVEEERSVSKMRKFKLD